MTLWSDEEVFALLGSGVEEALLEDLRRNQSVFERIAREKGSCRSFKDYFPVQRQIKETKSEIQKLNGSHSVDQV